MTSIHRNLAAMSVAAGALALGVPARSEPAAYPTMAPLAQYLIADRAAEIALAKSAAPPAIAADATVLVLGSHGYETAAKGTNGFTCLVERSWMSPFDSADFWNPKIRGPVCYNAPAARSLLPFRFQRTEWVLAGWSRDRMLTALQAQAAKKALPAPEPGAMSYMLSPQQYLNDTGKAWKPHLMFHVPTADAAAWGANLAGSPVMLDTAHAQGPEPETVFMIAAPAWSDGAPAGGPPAHAH
jgi:hypothetical protein